mmetsp:Transcript_20470/g.72388  ORF Transcript_20470/g.72388 Transcript_20470/m.72388 type:complete len:204 (+) Transcript_20470:324-935(+)
MVECPRGRSPERLPKRRSPTYCRLRSVSAPVSAAGVAIFEMTMFWSMVSPALRIVSMSSPSGVPWVVSTSWLVLSSPTSVPISSRSAPSVSSRANRSWNLRIGRGYVSMSVNARYTLSLQYQQKSGDTGSRRPCLKSSLPVSPTYTKPSDRSTKPKTLRVLQVACTAALTKLPSASPNTDRAAGLGLRPARRASFSRRSSQSK